MTPPSYTPSNPSIEAEFRDWLADQYGHTFTDEVALRAWLESRRRCLSAMTALSETAPPEIAWWNFAVKDGMIRDSADGVSYIKACCAVEEPNNRGDQADPARDGSSPGDPRPSPSSAIDAIQVPRTTLARWAEWTYNRHHVPTRPEDVDTMLREMQEALK